MKKLIGIVAFVLLVSIFSYSSNVDARPRTGQVLKVMKQAVKVLRWSESLSQFFGDSGEKSGALIQKCGCWGTNYQPPSEP